MMTNLDSLNAATEWLRNTRPRRITVLTGAGISAESGIPTFRGDGGLWRNFRAEELATPGAFHRDPELVWEWYEWRRDLIREAKPNAAHLAIARLEEALGDDFALVTQNVDGLHRAAGSTRIHELHGNIFRVKCAREGKPREAAARFPVHPPKCECGALLRPDVVWFGEALDPAIWRNAVEAVANADLLLIVGTSAIVYPAAGLVGLLQRGEAIEVNPDATPISGACRFAIATGASAGVPPLVDAILGERHE